MRTVTIALSIVLIVVAGGFDPVEYAVYWIVNFFRG